MSDKTKIEPALTAEQWKRGMTVNEAIDRYSEHAAIAVANAALPDSDPRKITRGTIAALDWVLWQAGATGDYTHSVEDRLRPIRDALASYLPPEPERCSHGILLNERCEECRREHPEWLSHENSPEP